MDSNLSYSVKMAIGITNKTIYPRYMWYYSQIFGTTNENFKQIPKIVNFENKKILLTGSSCDQYLSMVLNGTKEEVIYDINTLSEFYIFLKISALRNLQYEDFIKFMFPYTNKKCFLNPSMIKTLGYELPKHVNEFWYNYLSEINHEDITNFICYMDENLEQAKNKLPYLDEKNYYRLQKLILKKEYPKFINMDIINFASIVDDKFDIIYLSNIIECSQSIMDDDICPPYFADEEWIEFIKKDIYNHLNSNGEIVLYKNLLWGLEAYKNSNFKIKSFINDKAGLQGNILTFKK